MRFIPSKIHGVLDYAVAVLLIAAPLALGFGAEAQAALWIPVSGGLALLVYSLFTDYSAGLRRAISFRLHLAIDFAAGVALVASPFLVGLGGLPRAFFLVVGAAVVAVVACTDPEVEPPSARRVGLVSRPA